MVRKKKKKVPATRQRSIFSRREVNKYYNDLLKLIDCLRDYARAVKIREGILKEEIDSKAWKRFDDYYGNNVWKLVADIEAKEAEIRKQVKRINKFSREIALGETISYAMIEQAVMSKRRRASYQSSIRLAKETIRRNRTVVIGEIITWEDLERSYQNEIFLEEVENDWKCW